MKNLLNSWIKWTDKEKQNTKQQIQRTKKKKKRNKIQNFKIK